MTKERLISAMDAAGYTYDSIESADNYLRFFAGCGLVITMDSWQDCKEWFDGVVFDDPEISDKVESILHPEHV